MTSSMFCGQLALKPLPPLPSLKNSEEVEETMVTYKLPVQLKLSGNYVKRKGTASGVLGNGMDVYKVSKTGKRQQRRVAISPDNRKLLISSNVGLMGIFKKKNATETINGNESFRKIEISTIDRIIRGQNTDKFIYKKPREKSVTQMMPVAEEKLSLSIVFRVSTAAMDSFVQEENLEVTKNSTSMLATLDLIIPSHNDLELFVSTIRNLMILNRKYLISLRDDVILLQYYWTEIGKSFDTTITQSEWSSVCCDSMSVGIGRNSVNALFRRYCISNKVNPEDGLSLQAAVVLLEQMREEQLRMGKHTDPCERVWNLLGNMGRERGPLKQKSTGNVSMISDGKSVGGSRLSASRSGPQSQNSECEEYVSAKAFLRFLHEEQKENDKTLSYVKDLFGRLNSQTCASQLDNQTTSKILSLKSINTDFITKSTFISYLRSDTNDLFNPFKGQLEHDDMDQPLCSYWINASHDTYIKSNSPRLSQKSSSDYTANVGMYTSALYRGCRCLELDVWDGINEQKQHPVVRFDELNNNGTGPTRKVGILFSDVINAIHSFLVSEPASFPVILIIEAKCCKNNQDKMSEILESVLGSDDMLYIPDDEEGSNNLPSPNALRGKVVIKAKIPKQGQTKVLCDDFDELNDIDPFDTRTEKSDDVISVLPGITDTSSILFDSSMDLENDPDDMIRTAKAEAMNSKQRADAAEERAFSINVKLNRTTEIANKLMTEAGINNEYVMKELGQRSGSGLDSVTKASLSNDGTDAEIVVNATLSTRGSSFETKESKVGFFQWLMGFIDDDNDDDDVSDENSCRSSLCAEESRHDAENRNYSFYSSAEDSRDSYVIEDEDSDYDMDVDVKDFSESSGTLMSELKDMAQNECTAKKRSLSDLHRQLQDNDSVTLGGVEVQHFYSSTVDYALTEQKVAQEAVEKAAKSLETASSVLNKWQEEYGKVKMVEKFFSLGDKLAESTKMKKQAETASKTAKAEYQISAERALETADAAENARLQRDKAHKAAKELQYKYGGYEANVSSRKAAFEDCKKAYEVCHKKYEVVKFELEKVSTNIIKIESSHRFKVEKREESRGAVRSGPTLKSHKNEIEKQLTLTKKLQEVRQRKLEAEKQLESSRLSLQEAERQLEEHETSMRKAETYADTCDTYVEQMDQLEEEENDAAKMREEASLKAEAIVAKYDERLKLLSAEIEETKNNIPQKFDLGDRQRASDVLEEVASNYRAAKREFDEAEQAYKWANARLAEANSVLAENSDILCEAKKNAVQREHRLNAEQTMKENALKALKSMQVLEKEAADARVRASELRLIAAEKAAAYRRAMDYKHRRSMVRDMSPSLAKLVLISSSKFRYFEESLALPANEMLSLSEGRMMQLLANEDELHKHHLTEFSRSHLARVFPSRHKKLRKQSQNFNPVLPWSLGCQIVSMNQQICDAYILVNDGRFRANGSCGYVLKPDRMIHPQGKLFNRQTQPPIPDKWQFKILSGHNLPKTRKKTISGSLNPRVRVTLYDGGGEDPVVHVTNTVKNNGLNPVWDESIGAIFDNIKYPDSAIVMFSVWDLNSDGSEDFIAAAAIPISCMREGYRSVPLFDLNHMRCGAHAFTSLFIHAAAV